MMAIHHMYSVNPLEESSLDTLEPLPEDEFGNRYVVVILDNFSKFIGLYSATSTSTRDFVSALLKWIGIFGLPKKIRSDGGSQFTSNLAQELRIVLGFDHLVVIPYHPQANSLVERRMKEIMIHLRALIYEKRIKSEWSHFLPLVQRIMNYSVEGSVLSRLECYSGK
jgi:transposase InsO family protein